MMRHLSHHEQYFYQKKLLILKGRDIRIENLPLRKDLNNDLDLKVLLNFIEKHEHQYTTVHKKLCFFIIKRIYRRVKKGYRFGNIKISDKGLIIDGNHRYIAYKLAEIEFQTIKGTSSHCDEPKNFNEIKIDVIEDWDLNSESSRKYCNDDFLRENEFYNN